MEAKPLIDSDSESESSNDRRDTKKIHPNVLYFSLLLIVIVLIFVKCFLDSVGPTTIVNVPNNAKCKIQIPHNIRQLSRVKTFENVEQESNLAALYWLWWNGTNDLGNQKLNVKYCDSVTLTEPYNIKHNNIHWQQFEAVPIDEGDEVLHMYLYNAYYDSRVANQPLVKLLTMNDQELMGADREWFCLLWFDGLKAPALVKVVDYFHIWPTNWVDRNRYGSFHPQLISCPIPAEHANQVPRAVSLQARGNCAQVEQKPSNVLRVLNNRERDPKFKKPKSFGVCVKAFRYADYDMSVRIVEWLELLRVLGADRVYFYVYGTNENVQKVLKHYKKDGLVDWRFITLPGQQVNVNSLYNILADKLSYKFTPSESLELNDCLNKNLYQHDYLAVVDIDEVIMPQGSLLNWHQLVASIENQLSTREIKTKAYYKHMQAHVCEMDEEADFYGETIPEHLFMFRHTFRETLQESSKDKCFHRTDLVTSVHNHLPTRCIGTSGYFNCDGVYVDTSKSIMMHYRRNHQAYAGMKTNTPYVCGVKDRTVWRYYKVVKWNVQKELNEIFKQ